MNRKEEEAPLNLTDFNIEIEDTKLKKGPPTIYYIPDFITPVEEKEVMEALYKTPKPRWTQLSNRRLQNWGGIPHPKGMIAEEIPQWLKTYTKKISELDIFEGSLPNHVLINEYTPGQGIMPHLDGPLFYPTISTINLGSHTILNLYRQTKNSENDTEQESTCWNDRFAYSLLLEPRSLLILKDETYHNFLHGIQEITEDIISEDILNLDRCSSNLSPGSLLPRGTRVSLTIRHVPKTTKPMIKLGR